MPLYSRRLNEDLSCSGENKQHPEAARAQRALKIADRLFTINICKISKHCNKASVSNKSFSKDSPLHRSSHTQRREIAGHQFYN